LNVRSRKISEGALTQKSRSTFVAMNGSYPRRSRSSPIRRDIQLVVLSGHLSIIFCYFYWKNGAAKTWTRNF